MQPGSASTGVKARMVLSSTKVLTPEAWISGLAGLFGSTWQMVQPALYLPTVVDDADLLDSRVPGNPFNAGENLIAPVEHHPIAQAAVQRIAGQQEPALNLLHLQGSLPPEGQPGQRSQRSRHHQNGQQCQLQGRAPGSHG